MASSVAGGTVVVERSGACLSVRAASAPATPGLAALVVPEAGRAALVVDSSAAAAMNGLDKGVLAGLRGHLSSPPGPRPRGLRLLVGGAARYGPDGGPPLAARLAEALSVEVVAPDGPLVVLRRGELFSAGPAAAWWEFAPGRRPERVGARFPSPAWQWQLPPDASWPTVSRQVAVTPLPCGLWVRGAGNPPADLSDPAYAVPPTPDHPAVLVGKPGETCPPVAGVAEVIGALPPALRQRYVLVPYGPDAAGAPPAAQRLADTLGVRVQATHGVPAYAADGSVEFVVVDDAGRPTWRPFVFQSAYYPGAAAPTPLAWLPVLAALLPAGPACFWLADGWVAEAVPCGLLVRPAAAGAEPLVTRRPVDPQHVDLVVTAPVWAPDNVPVAVLESIGRLARAQPAGVQGRLRMLITERVDPPELVGLAGALRLPIRRLTPHGISPVERVQSAAAAGHAEAGPLPVGRLHASAVPTATGVAPAVVPAARIPVVPADPPSRVGNPSTEDVRPSIVDGGSPGDGQPPPTDPVTVAAAAPVASPSADAPVAPPTAAAPAAVAVPVRPDPAGGGDRRWQQGSTASERQQFRASLGWRYDAASRYVTRLLSDRPGLRAAAAAEDGMVTDLAAVHVFATSDHSGQSESLRTGTVHPGQQAFLSCVVSGLRRLPTLTGPVLRGGPDDPAAVEAYLAGSDVLEAGLLPAVADPDADLPGGVEVLIWSSTARRLDGLVDESNAVRLVFLPGTVFRVLDVDRSSEPCRVLMAETPLTWQGHADARRDERVLDRLRAAAQARAQRPGGDQRPTGGSLVALPGLVPAEAPRGAA